MKMSERENLSWHQKKILLDALRDKQTVLISLRQSLHDSGIDHECVEDRMYDINLLIDRFSAEEIIEAPVEKEFSAADFNRKFCVGDKVRYINDLGDEEIRVLRSEAWDLSNGLTIVKFDGKSGGYDVNRISEY